MLSFVPACRGILPGLSSSSPLGAELELGLIQIHMAQKPVLRVEVDALDACQVKNAKGGIGQAQ